jgi:hypothetical protein
MTRIESIDDARIAHYLSLKDRELARQRDRFVAEGEYIVRRLLESDYPCESILVIVALIWWRPSWTKPPSHWTARHGAIEWVFCSAMSRVDLIHKFWPSAIGASRSRCGRELTP